MTPGFLVSQAWVALFAALCLDWDRVFWTLNVTGFTLDLAAKAMLGILVVQSRHAASGAIVLAVGAQLFALAPLIDPTSPPGGPVIQHALIPALPWIAAAFCLVGGLRLSGERRAAPMSCKPLETR